MGSKNKNKRKNKQKKDSDDNDNRKKIITDSRFASVHSDPRFQNVPKQKSKVEIDSRFNRMFTDKNFASSSAPYDKRGRPKEKSKSSDNSLKHYYKIEEENKKKEEEEKESESDSESELEETGDVHVVIKTESEDEDDDVDESSSDEEDEEEDVYESEVPEEEQETIPEIEKETRRLAVVNMDWRHVKAVDLYVILSSFLPKEGQILSVAVYPSEFGIQQMKDEEIHGPVGLFDNEDKNSDDEDNDEIDEEKLRAYEKSRLRYYYAVVECDSSATADYLYKVCDGVEFERSSNKLDLRFIPDSMEFKHPPRDVAREAPTNYGGLDFYTKALQHSNVHLSWDDDEPERSNTLKRKYNADQLAELEIKEFLASEESESNDEDDNVTEQSDKRSKKRDMYRALLQSGDGSGDDEEDGQDMEVTFNTGLEDISKRILEKKDKKSETVWEAYLRKRCEKNKARKNKSKYSSDEESSDTDQEAVEEADDFFVEEPSVKKSKKGSRIKGEKEGKQHQDTDVEANASMAELELLLADDKGMDNGLKGYNLKPKKAKGKKRNEVPNEDKIPTVDYEDPRFSALFTSPLYALDPTDPQFKRSAAYARQVAQRQQKTDSRELVDNEPSNLPSSDIEANMPMKSDVSASKMEKHELSSLVRSVKMKSQLVQLPSNGKKDRLSSIDAEEKDVYQPVKKKTKVTRN
ncbi:pre-rRNA-processing protein esf1 [Mangifera indica]|uniref:pre-rRNA-processing protein esf1 n=1 Tax=Mangifera indica TaxID=29780 RepID=UPI001CFA3951|nr:pre-rRNA-processing protein esf1 [Mangifera indica]